MLALRSASTSDKALTETCTPNILPCRIHYDGPIESSKHHWQPAKDEKDGKHTAYFRGRKLQGRTVRLPEDYQGVVALSTDRVLPVSTRDDSIEDEAAQDPVKILQTQATFDDIVVWGHENEPESDDVFVKAVDEWIKFAETMHEDGQRREKSS